jgi:glycosyltransferase involved in cell wall biosynthesis/peptidoglycan/xylan/chitin deacetylase (PgdA/CDA1 family)
MLNKIYYLLKPLIPWQVRLALRRQRAAARRETYNPVWPIDPAAGRIPPNWPGWPEGKKFALVMTHDVEGAKGLSRVPRLMELEARNGFRSSFNFVPAGEYSVPQELRADLDREGFEIGVHGLEHDGKLYASKAEFAAKARHIRDYLRLWDACGFRSPLMQHKLPWIHQLGVEYDASTFDTDPFEPEPDAVGTIFPFWVPGANDSGFVELPYTLAQDFTLFVVLREASIDIWKTKLDWIAERGGMALLNTHPDYMCFEGSPKRDEYPVAFYEELLRYAHEKYEGQFWSANPREVSRYYCSSLAPEARNSRKKICMLVHNSYETDNRVRRYAEALAKRGDHVDVIALAGGTVPLGAEEICGATVYRVQHRIRNERGKWTYAWRLLRFLFVSSIFLTRRHQRIRYDVVHVHNIPDFLVFAAWYPKFTGSKIILDIHDIVPELFANKFDAEPGGLYTGFLKFIEKAAAAFADFVIVSNHLWYEKLIHRSVPKEKCAVFLNHVDSSLFYRRSRTRTDDKIIVIFPGSFQWHQGLDLAIEAFALVHQQVPNTEFHIYGAGDEKADLVSLTARLGLNDSVKFRGSVPLETIADVISNADIGVVPKRADSFGNEAYSTKIMEFMSQGVAVVLSRTKIDNFYFDDSVVRFFESGNIQELAVAMLEVIENKQLRHSLIAGGYHYVDLHSWDRRKAEYLGLVDSLSTEKFPNDDEPLVEPTAVADAVLDDSETVSNRFDTKEKTFPQVPQR